MENERLKQGNRTETQSLANVFSKKDGLMKAVRERGADLPLEMDGVYETKDKRNCTKTILSSWYSFCRNIG